MHPLVRNLYKRVILVGRDYPAGIDYVRTAWKKALRDPKNCPWCYQVATGTVSPTSNGMTSSPQVQLNNPNCREELLHAVNRGRYMIKEMIGVIQLKKYRAMRQRYDDATNDTILQEAMQRLHAKTNVSTSLSNS